MLGSLLFLPLVGAAVIGSRGVNQNCPGYKATRVHERGNTLTADLTLAGEPCNSYGTDLKDLKLLVEYQTGQCWREQPEIWASTYLPAS
jgi:alpha-glucosidase